MTSTKPDVSGEAEPSRNRKRKPTNRWGIGFALLAVLALVAGCGAGNPLAHGPLAFLTGGDAHPTLAGGPGGITWQLPPPPGIKTSPIDDWYTSDLVAVGLPNTVTAYSAADGHQTWQLTPPPRPGDPPSEFCEMSQDTADGIGLVSYGPPTGIEHQNDCESVAAVDLHTGAVRWTADKPRDAMGYETHSMYPQVVGNLAVFANRGSVTAVDLHTGHPVWNWDELSHVGDSCNVHDLAGRGSTVAVVSACDFHPPATITTLDTATGHVKSRQQPPPEMNDRPAIVNVEPLTVLSTPEEIGGTGGQYQIFDETGHATATIPLNTPAGRLDEDPINDQAGDFRHHRYRVVVDHGLLVAATQQVSADGGGMRQTNQFVAFDVKTGQMRWHSALGPDIAGTIIGPTPSGLLAIHDGTYEKPVVVWHLSWSDGAVTPASQQPYPKKPSTVTMCHFTYDPGKNTVYGVNLLGFDATPLAFALH